MQKGHLALMDYYILILMKGLYDNPDIHNWKKRTLLLAIWSGVEVKTLTRHIKRLIRKGLATEENGILKFQNRSKIREYYAVSDPQWFDSRICRNRDLSNSRNLIKQISYEKISFNQFEINLLAAYEQQKELMTGCTFLGQERKQTITELKNGGRHSSHSFANVIPTNAEVTALKKRMGNCEMESSFIHLDDVKRIMGFNTREQASRRVKELGVQKVERFSKKKPNYRRSTEKFNCYQLANHYRFEMSQNWAVSFRPLEVVQTMQKFKEELIEEGAFIRKGKVDEADFTSFIDATAAYVEKQVKVKRRAKVYYEIFNSKGDEVGRTEKVMIGKSEFILPILTEKIDRTCQYHAYTLTRKTKKNPQRVKVTLTDDECLMVDEFVIMDLKALTHASFHSLMKNSWYMTNCKDVFDIQVEQYKTNVACLPKCYINAREENMIITQKVEFARMQALSEV